jgi:uncharacterized membrane protein YtjA (UPF0391 family)
VADHSTLILSHLRGISHLNSLETVRHDRCIRFFVWRVGGVAGGWVICAVANAPWWLPSTFLSQKENLMLTTLSSALLAQTVYFPTGLVSLAVVFFIIALVAYVLGARGVAGMSAGIGRTLLFVFLVLAVIFAIVAFVNHGTV